MLGHEIHKQWQLQLFALTLHKTEPVGVKKRIEEELIELYPSLGNSWLFIHAKTRGADVFGCAATGENTMFHSYTHTDR